MPTELEVLAGSLSTAVQGYKSLSGTDAAVRRREIVRLAKDILDEADDPAELGINSTIKMAEHSTIRLFIEWKAFDHIPEESSIAYSELAAKLDAEEALVRRLCWMLVSTGVLKQVGEDGVAHTKFSRIFPRDNPQGIYFKVVWDCMMVPGLRWVDYFRERGRKEPEDPCANPHNFAWGQEDRSYFELMSGQRGVELSISMQNADQLLPITGMFPFSWIAENAKLFPDDAPLVVDVGGGRGQALLRMMEECPAIPAERLVLQDRAEVIADAEKLDDPALRGVKKQAADFFEPQPVKGALVYYLRRVMHDWSDKNCAVILSHVREAMTDRSRILVSEQIVTNPPSSITAGTDLALLCLGAKERSAEDWHGLAKRVGLEVVKIWRHPASPFGVVEFRKSLQ